MATDVNLKPGESVKVNAPSGETLTTTPTASSITIKASGSTTTPEPPPVQPPTGDSKVAITRAGCDKLPKTGPAYAAVKSKADSSTRPNLNDQDSSGNVSALARGLLNNKAGVAADLKAARSSLSSVQRTLALSRELQPLPLAAKLVSLTDSDVGFPLGKFFRDAIAHGPIEGRDADNVREAARIDPTNWGCHARATVMWVAWYLNDKALIDEAYDNVKRYLEGGANGFTYHSDDVTWGKATIAKKGTSKSGVDLDGCIHDIYRGGTFPNVGSAGQNYVWEASQGNVSMSIAADMAGHPEVWDLGDKALLRSLNWMYKTKGVGGAAGDDRWQMWVAKRVYGSIPGTLPSPPTSPGKGFGYTDWLYA